MTAEDLKERNFEIEFRFITSRSSGAGGQNVNKVSSKVELKWHIENSGILSTEEKEILNEKLKNRINAEGFLSIVCQIHRSQLQNKETAIEKLYLIVSKALTPEKKRKPTIPTETSRIKRLNDKKILAEKKSLRKRID